MWGCIHFRNSKQHRKMEAVKKNFLYLLYGWIDVPHPFHFEMATTISLLIAGLCLLAVTTCDAANPFWPITRLSQASKDASYAEAYVSVRNVNPNKLAIDNKALREGLKSARNIFESILTFDSNEYAQYDNPLRLAFVQPPHVFGTLTKLQSKSDASDGMPSNESTEKMRFDFWIPL
jgi:hypothetical protein